MEPRTRFRIIRISAPLLFISVMIQVLSGISAVSGRPFAVHKYNILALYILLVFHAGLGLGVLLQNMKSRTLKTVITTLFWASVIAAAGLIINSVFISP
jgi:hypothetical protein